MKLMKDPPGVLRCHSLLRGRRTCQVQSDTGRVGNRQGRGKGLLVKERIEALEMAATAERAELLIASTE